MDAIGTSVHLRSARLDEIDQGMVEPVLLHVILKGQRFHRLGRGLVWVQLNRLVLHVHEWAHWSGAAEAAVDVQGVASDVPDGIFFVPGESE
jgi:hypothetical protein